jgi:hypothetical protein
MDADQFYELAVDPNFPNEMIFSLNAVNPENPTTFSKEGVEGITDQLHHFLMARIFGSWKKTNMPPKHMKVHVSLTFDDVSHDESELYDGALPWFSGEVDDIGLLQADGQHRIPRDGIDN